MFEPLDASDASSITDDTSGAAPSVVTFVSPTSENTVYKYTDILRNICIHRHHDYDQGKRKFILPTGVSLLYGCMGVDGSDDDGDD